MGLNSRGREILFRYGLAEKYTSPSRTMKPSLDWQEIQNLIQRGFLFRNNEGRVRLTGTGLAEVRGELALALGKDAKFEAGNASKEQS